MSPLTTLSQTYSDVVAGDSPLVYWRFDNDLTDVMGNVDLNPAAAPEFVDGPIGGSAYSSSQGQAWAAAFGTVGLNGLENFSYEMWINLTGDNEGKYILQRIGLGENSPGENSLIYQNGAIEFFTSNAAELEEPAVYEIPDNTDEWHHFVLTYNYQDILLKFYVDGVEVMSNDFAVLNPFFGGNSDELYIGASRRNPEAQTFNGSLDEVAIYGKELSAEEVAAHYNAADADAYSAAVVADSPISYWRFENTFSDETGDYDLIPSGVNFVQGPQSDANKALFGRVTSTAAEALYDMTDFSYELWFNPINLSAQSYILFRRPGGAQHSVIYAYNPDSLEFFFASGGVRPLVTIPNETDQWYHCVIVNDTVANQMSIYIDGELATTVEGASAEPGDGNLVVVGGSDQGDNFNGYIDEVSIYNYVLSEEQIQAHFNAPIESTGIVEWSLME
ncbi:LamG domain-containing protein [bacterium]|nr:LamG domain-containing protein [bacterium]